MAPSPQSFDVAVIGGGLVGASIAYGLAGAGRRVALLDEGDRAVRASRGNFALVWVQGKGLGNPAYAAWTRLSSDLWSGFARELRDITDLDVRFERPGGFALCLSEVEWEARALMLRRFHNQPGGAEDPTIMLERTQVAGMLPGLGREVVGGSFNPHDGHVNSLRLFRALHTALDRLGAAYLPDHGVTRIDARGGGGFALSGAGFALEAGQVVLAAGNANASLAPLVGLAAPMRPEAGQILVTERVAPFLRHPIVTLRQTDEGSVMIGDSREETDDPAGLNLRVNGVIASRAMRMFPHLAEVNIVRSWRAIRVMPQDGFPIYDHSARHPGAFLATCHSGVTLAAAHALTLAPMIANGALNDPRVAAFSAARFTGGTDVQAAE